jgi:hypothetical protein
MAATLTVDDLQSTMTVFGKSLFNDLKGLHDKQTRVLGDLQNFVGQKFDTITTHLEKIDDLVDAVNALQQADSGTNKEPGDNVGALQDVKAVTVDKAKSMSSSVKVMPVYAVNDAFKADKKEKKKEEKPNNLFTNLVSGLFSKKDKRESATKKPFFGKETMIVELEHKSTRLLLEDVLDSEFTSFYHKLETPLDEIKYILKDTLNENIKKREKPKTILDYLGDIAKLMGPILGPLLLMLGGAAASIAGIAALISGLTDNGPLKGLKKLFARGGLSLGLTLIKNGAKKIINTFKLLGKLLFGEKALKTVSETLKSVSKTIFEKVTFLPKLFFNRVKDFLFKIPGRLVKYVKSFFGIGEKAVAEGVKVVPKMAKGGIFKSMLSGLGKFFGKNVLKRIPIIGTILGLSFAYSKFKNGNVPGGIIDVVSALAGLLDLVVPGLGTALSLGLDMFNAFLDIKAGGSDAKASGKKLDFLKDVGEKIGKAVKGMIYGLLDWLISWIPGDWLKGKVVSGLSAIGIDLEGYKKEQAEEEKIQKAKQAAEAAAPKNQSPVTTANQNEPVYEPSEDQIAVREPESPIPATDATAAQADKLGDVHEAVTSQNNMLAQLLAYSKQTAESTNALVQNFMTFKENAGKTIQMNNISSPQTFFSAPATSTDLRASMYR